MNIKDNKDNIININITIPISAVVAFALAVHYLG